MNEMEESNRFSGKSFTTIEIEENQCTNVEAINACQNGNKSQTTYNIDDNYDDVYRTGNFGMFFGKINRSRGFKWMYAHLFLTSLILFFTIIITGLLNGYFRYNMGKTCDVILGFLWTNSLIGLISGLSNFYFIRNYDKLQKPLRFLLLVRFFAILNFTALCMSFLIGTLLLDAKYDGVATTPTVMTKLVFSIIYIIIDIEMVVMLSFACIPNCQGCCCPKYCVFEEGEYLAPREVLLELCKESINYIYFLTGIIIIFIILNDICEFVCKFIIQFMT